MYRIRFWLGKKFEAFSRWLLRGYPGFTEINYKGKPVTIDDSTKTEFWPEHSNFADKAAEMAPMTFQERIDLTLPDLTDQQRRDASSSDVLMDRVLNSQKWDTPIKKGYERPKS